jgi:hypothetical protein
VNIGWVNRSLCWSIRALVAGRLGCPEREGGFTSMRTGRCWGGRCQGLAVGCLQRGIELAFIDADGVRSREPLLTSWNTPFETFGQVRRFTSRRGQRSFSGLWYFATSHEHVGYESWLERDRLMLLDADPDVVAVASQPFWLCWQDGQERPVRHAPDYFVRHRDGTAVVIDVRADDRIGPEDAAKFAATARACESVGWEFERVGALDACSRRTCVGCRATGISDITGRVTLTNSAGCSLDQSR